MVGVVQAAFDWAFGKHGEKPVVPDLPSLSEVQGQAVKANLSNLPDIGKLGANYNKLAREELLKGMEKIAPGSTQLLKLGSDVIASGLKGELSPDVQDSIARSSAAQAVAGGYAGSGMGRNLTFRDLGRTSYDVQQQNLNSAMRWLGMTAQFTPQFNYGSAFVNTNMAMNWAEQQYNVKWLQNQLKAMPSPEDQAWNQMVNSMGYGADYIGTSVVGMYTGQRQPADLGSNPSNPQWYQRSNAAANNMNSWVDSGPDMGVGSLGGFGGAMMA